MFYFKKVKKKTYFYYYLKKKTLTFYRKYRSILNIRNNKRKHN